SRFCRGKSQPLELLRRNPNSLRTSLLLRVQAAYDAAFMAAQNIPAPVKLREKAQLMTASEMEAALARIAAAIVSRNGGVNGLGFMGIRRRGVPMAERLSKLIKSMHGATIPIGSLGIIFYLDDPATDGPKPVVQETNKETP